jgi:hypothetical protein
MGGHRQVADLLDPCQVARDSIEKQNHHTLEGSSADGALLDEGSLRQGRGYGKEPLCPEPFPCVAKKASEARETAAEGREPPATPAAAIPKRVS